MTDAHDTHTVADSRGGATTAMSVPDASDLADRVVENIETVIVDQHAAVEQS